MPTAALRTTVRRRAMGSSDAFMFPPQASAVPRDLARDFNHLATQAA
jgi:hypothetical protein